PSQNITSAYTMQTYTAGASSLFTNRLSNELRLNYSSNETTGRNFFDAFAGNTPANMAQLTGLGSGSDVFIFLCYDAFCMQPDQSLSAGAVKQWNLVDTVSYSLGRHQLKFGVDYRRLASHAIQSTLSVAFFYFDENSIENNSPAFSIATVFGPAYPLYNNFSAFAPDEWNVSRGLNVALGLRREVNPPAG